MKVPKLDLFQLGKNIKNLMIHLDLVYLIIRQELKKTFEVGNIIFKGCFIGVKIKKKIKTPMNFMKKKEKLCVDKHITWLHTFCGSGFMSSETQCALLPY